MPYGYYTIVELLADVLKIITLKIAIIWTMFMVLSS